MDEKEAFNRVMSVLKDHNLTLTKDFTFKKASHGCFYIVFCPRRHPVIDVMYFLDNIPDIRSFKIIQDGNVMKMSLKIKLRGEHNDRRHF